MSQKEDVPQHITAKALADRVRSASRGFELVFLLDYDGTLTPIVDRPDDAHLAAETRQVLRDLSAQHPVAIISGRDRHDVQKRVDVDSVYYAGNHGFDISGPANNSINHIEGADFIPEIRQTIASLEGNLAELPGVLVEGKTYSVAVHTRLVADTDIPAVEKMIAEILEKHPRLLAKRGKCVVELIPDIDWNKGYAAMWLIERLQPANGTVFPVFLGDDQTDEDVFAALPDNGLGIMVAQNPRPSKASLRLGTTGDVVGFLKMIAAQQP